MTENPLIKMTVEPQEPKSRKVKREWIKRGYEHQLSFYGAIHDNQKKDYEGRRIEVLSNVQYNPENLKFIMGLFDVYIPKHRYVILTYDGKENQINLVGVFA